MIVLDANLLLYAYDRGSDFYARANPWLARKLSGDELVGLPWQSISAFLRIMTDRRLPGDRMNMIEATDVVGRWLALPNVRVPAPGSDHWSVLRRVLLDGQVSGPVVSDAHLAALTIEHGGVLHTTDRDFSARLIRLARLAHFVRFRA